MNLFVPIIYFTISMLFLLAVYLYLNKRKKKQKELFNFHWKKLETGIESLNLEEVIENGSALLWNDNMFKAHYDELLTSLDSLDAEIKKSDSLRKELDILYDKKGWNATYS